MQKKTFDWQQQLDEGGQKLHEDNEASITRRAMLTSSGMTMIRAVIGASSACSIADFFARSRNEMSSNTLETLIQLRREGIRIPLPISDDSGSQNRQVVVQQLITVASDVTFKALFTRSHRDVSQTALDAVRKAREIGLLGWWDNGKCCTMRGTPKADCVTTNKKSWCNMTPTDDCSAASDDC